MIYKVYNINFSECNISDSMYFTIPLKLLNKDCFNRISILCYTYFKKLSNIKSDNPEYDCYHISYQDFLMFYQTYKGINERYISEDIFNNIYKELFGLDIIRCKKIYAIPFTVYNLKTGKEKYSLLHLKEFIQIIQLNKRHDLTDRIFKVYLYLKFLISKGDGECHYALSYYEKITGINKKTFKEILKLLKDLKLIYYEKSNFQVLYPNIKIPKRLYIIINYQFSNHEYIISLLKSIKEDPHFTIVEN